MFKVWLTRDGYDSAESFVSNTADSAVTTWVSKNLTRLGRPISISVLESEEDYEVRYMLRRGELVMVGIHELETF